MTRRRRKNEPPAAASSATSTTTEAVAPEPPPSPAPARIPWPMVPQAHAPRRASAAVAATNGAAAHANGTNGVHVAAASSSSVDATPAATTNGHEVNGHALPTTMQAAPPEPEPPPAPPPPPRVYAPAGPPVAADDEAVAAAATATPSAAATNRWAQLQAERGIIARKMHRAPVPQGETQLVHAWQKNLFIDGIPGQAMTIWLRRTQPVDNAYEWFIPGDAVEGPGCDRKLYEYADKNRRQRGIREHFTGRIRALLSDGSQVDVGSGEIEFPPAVDAPGQQPTWNQGQNAPGWNGANQWGTPYGPYGGPPMWGGGSGWGGGAPSFANMFPWWMMGMNQPAQQPPPPQVQQDPQLLAIWQSQQASAQAQLTAAQNNQQTLFMELLRAQLSGGKRDGDGDGIEKLARYAQIVDTLRGPQKSSPMDRYANIDGNHVFFKDDGSVDPAATVAVGAMKDVKDIAKDVIKKRMMGGQGLGGAHAPKKKDE